MVLATFLSLLPDQNSLLKFIRQALVDSLLSIQQESREKVLQTLRFYVSRELFHPPIFTRNSYCYCLEYH